MPGPLKLQAVKVAIHGLVFTLLVAGVAFAGVVLDWPSVAWAAPPKDSGHEPDVSNVRVTSFSPISNSTRIAWSGSITFPPIGCGSNPQSSYTLSAGGRSIVTKARYHTSSEFYWGNGGTRSFSVTGRWYKHGDADPSDDDDSYYCHYTSASTSGSYTFPTRPSITAATYDAADDTVDITWSSNRDFAYWLYVLFPQSSGWNEAYASTPVGNDLATGESTRSATIENLEAIAGNDFRVGIVGFDNESSEVSFSNSAYLNYSSVFNVSGPPAHAACTEADVVTIEDLFEYSVDQHGDFDSFACSLDPTDGNVSLAGGYGAVTATEGALYSFQITQGREVDFTLNPTTLFPGSIGSGQYRMRVRSGSLTGTFLEGGNEASAGGFVLDNLLIGAAADYYIEVMRYGYGGAPGFSVNLTYPRIAGATPTPIPTPTPRISPNLDVRIYPDPRSINYVAGNAYAFNLEGNADYFPARVRVGNPNAVLLGTGQTSIANCTGTNQQINRLEHGDSFYVHVCNDSGSTNSIVEVLRVSDDALLTRSQIYVPGSRRASVPRAALTNPGIRLPEEAVQELDYIGFGVLVGALCQALGVGCDIGLLKQGFLLLVTGLVTVLPTLRAGGRTSSAGLGIGLSFGCFTLMLGYILLGTSAWYALIGILVLTILAGLAVMSKVGRVNI